MQQKTAIVLFVLLGVHVHCMGQTIEWDQSTLDLVQTHGNYARMIRLADGDLMAAFDWGAKIYVRRSSNEGKWWGSPQFVANSQYPNGIATNVEILQLQNGEIMISYNDRPTDGVNPFTINMTKSANGGSSWSASQVLYTAGTVYGNGVWEPAQIQLPTGEIQLYFANEYPYSFSGEQEISMLRSFTNGTSWSAPEQVSFRSDKRDGMAVPLILNNGDIVIAIEDNGLNGNFKPSIVSTSDNWHSPQRWGALNPGLPWFVYAGAPYIRQFPTGQTVLSVQSDENSSESQMAVYVGNDEARNFTNLSNPFLLPSNQSGLWNSLFIIYIIKEISIELSIVLMELVRVKAKLISLQENQFLLLMV